LIARQEFLSSLGYWILVAGLIGDILVLAIPERRGCLEKVLSAVFTVIVIVGVAIEHHADAKIAVLISQAESSTALKVTGRNLSPEQQDSVARQLNRFAGKRVGIFVYADDPEISHVGDTMRTLLMKSHWAIAEFLTGREFSRSVVGILIEVVPNADTMSRNAAAALASTLGSVLEVHGPQPIVAASGPASGLSYPAGVPGPPIIVTIGKRTPCTDRLRKFCSSSAASAGTITKRRTRIAGRRSGAPSRSPDRTLPAALRNRHQVRARSRA